MKIAVFDSPLVRESMEGIITQNPRFKVIEGEFVGDDIHPSVIEMNPRVIILGVSDFSCGIRALRRLRMLLPKACIVVMTNTSHALYHGIWKSEGADFFLDKSFGIQILLDLLNRLSSEERE